MQQSDNCTSERISSLEKALRDLLEACRVATEVLEYPTAAFVYARAVAQAEQLLTRTDGEDTIQAGADKRHDRRGSDHA